MDYQSAKPRMTALNGLHIIELVSFRQMYDYWLVRVTRPV